MTSPDHLKRVSDALRVFTPRQAIKKADHLAGRIAEISKVMIAIAQQGAHAIIYGDRGVGKSSLANCVAESVQSM